MRRRNYGDQSLVKKVAALNRKAMAQEKIVNLDAYRSATKQKESKSILVVDDEPIMRNAVKRIFERENYRVLMANDAMELSKIIESTKLDLVLLDINLPWVNGYEVCSLLKTHPLLKDLPIVIISGNKTEEEIQKGFEAGCDEYVTKPFEVEKIQKVVNELLLKSS